jgi:histidinol-phosphate aminotransferase
MMTSALARRGYDAIALYTPDRSACRVDLSDNTNAWGMPPAALDAIAASGSVARYPSPYGEELKVALSDYIGLPPRMIATGCGSDDVLDSAIRAFGEPGDRLAYTEPTFGMIPVFARLNGLSPVVASSIEALPLAGRILYVCSPNNPTGELTARGRVEALIRRCDGTQIVIVDEAYAEFAGSTVIDLVNRYDNLLVARTMSKAFGLAGLRVGYAAANPRLIAQVEKSRGPFKVSAPAEQAAVAVLTKDREWVREHVATARAMRDRLLVALRERGLDPLESSANFVFAPVRDAVQLARRMRELGVAVRAFESPSGLRITVGPWPMLAETLDALDQVRSA